MAKKFKRILSAIMFVALLIPAVARLEHHHDHNLYQKGTEELPAWFREHCAICNLEFSLFIIEELTSYPPGYEFSSYYINTYKSIYYQDLSDFSFLLRAPPAFTNS